GALDHPRRAGIRNAVPTFKERTSGHRQLTIEHRQLKTGIMEQLLVINLTIVLASWLGSCAPRQQPATAPVASTQGEWRSLFNGEDLSGWRPTGAAIWRVDQRDGWPATIVGGQEGDPKRAGN